MRRTLSTALLSAAAAFAATAAFGSFIAQAQTPHAMAPGAAMAAPVAATSVQIRDFAFQPAAIVVAPGATVTWTNADDEPHTVMANDRAYRSTPLDTDDQYSHVYATPGEYRYFCSLHPHMTGVVIVRAPNAAQGS